MNQKLSQQFKKIVNLHIPNQNAEHSLIGTCLISFGTGGMLIWGQISIYILSYLKYNNPDISMTQQNFIIDFALIPILFGMLFSYVIANKIGFTLLIRICCFLYPLGVILSSFTSNFYLFASFYIILSCTSYAMLTVPLLNCLWSNYSKDDSGKLAGISFFFHGAAQLIFSVLALYLINPENAPASVEYTEGGQIFLMFSNEIADNIPKALFILGALYTVFCLTGSYFINKKLPPQEPLLNYNPDESPSTIEDFQVNQQTQPQLKKLDNTNISNNNEALNDQTTLSINTLDSATSNLQDINTDFQNSKNTISNFKKIQELQEEAQVELFKKSINFKQGLFSQPFIIIFICTFIISLYGTFLLLNYKIYGITKINDDNFLTLIQGITILIAAFSNLAWGPLADSKNFKELYCITILIYSFFAATLPYAFDFKITAALWLSVIGIIHSGIYAITGPALIHYFGIEIASQLLPVKALALYGSGLLMPIFSYIVLKISSFDNLLFYLGVSCLLGGILTANLPKYYKNKN